MAFKKGDVVFIHNIYFDEWCDFKTGDLATVFYYDPEGNILIIEDEKEEYMICIDSRAVTIYNKDNWCKHFLRMMDGQ